MLSDVAMLDPSPVPCVRCSLGVVLVEGMGITTGLTNASKIKRCVLASKKLLDF